MTVALLTETSPVPRVSVVPPTPLPSGAAVYGSTSWQAPNYGSINDDEERDLLPRPMRSSAGGGGARLRHPDSENAGFSGFYLPASPSGSSTASSPRSNGLVPIPRL